jgi:formylglycine-generating enzyme required for sulfatase activity
MPPPPPDDESGGPRFGGRRGPMRGGGERMQRPLEPAGSYPPNVWGIYDMHGSVWEWCSDFYAADAYKTTPPVDPAGPKTGKTHVARGGCWKSPAQQCSSAYRNGRADPDTREPIYGFRVVCEIQK